MNSPVIAGRKVITRDGVSCYAGFIRVVDDQPHEVGGSGVLLLLLSGTSLKMCLVSAFFMSHADSGGNLYRRFPMVK